jgi:hypothetical protein
MAAGDRKWDAGDREKAAGDQKGPGRNFLRDGPEKTGAEPGRPGETGQAGAEPGRTDWEKAEKDRAGRGRPG